jgi:adenosine deaminase
MKPITGGGRKIWRGLAVALVLLGGFARARAADDAMRTLIYGVPKAELHIHFEGTLEPELYLELEERNGLTSPYASAEAVRERLRHGRDLKTFIEVYEELQSSMRTERDFHDVALAYFRKVRSQGGVYVEMFFDPQMHTTRGIPIATVLNGLAAARHDARQELGLRAEYIMCFNRERPAESASEILEAARPWLCDPVIGIGLDNPEEFDFPHKFQTVYARARELGLRLTSHCDPNQPNTIAHHWGVLNLLGVERIDHGVNVLDDPKLLATVRDRHIGFTECMSIFYSDIPGFVEERAGVIKRMLDQGLLVTLNSDDPGMMHSNYLADCLLITQQAAHLSRDEVLTLVRNSFTIAWLSDADRAA